MEKYLLRAVFRCIKGAPFAVTYWDDQTEIFGATGDEDPVVRIIFKEKFSLPEMLCDPEIKFSEAYMDQKIDFEGDLRALFSLLINNEEVFKKDGSKVGLLQHFMKSQAKKNAQKQLEDVQYHYDLGNDFFKLWLDPAMNYSCAYFNSPEDNLEDAQRQKNDHILKKLQLKEGETLLDIGSGWGHLIIKAAREYGVKTLGITLSTEQEEETKRRIKKEGLKDQVEVRLADYRDLCVEKQSFDKIVSVGMFEHVGRNYIPAYFSCVSKMLKQQGLSLLHTITHPSESPTNPFLAKYIFPWGYIPSLRETIWAMADHSFHVIDVESLRMHYAMTTDRWARNFEKVTDQVREKYGERFVRMWRLYLLGCTTSFRCSGLDVHQILFSKGLCNELPLTRSYIYN